MHRVEVAQRLVVRERERQMGDGVARVERDRDEVARPVLFVAGERLVEHLAPVVDHGLEQAVGVERVVRASAGGRLA